MGVPINLGVQWQCGIRIFQVFGRFSAKLGPKTTLERRGSSCSAGCTKNQGAPEGPRRGPGGAPEGPRRGPPGPGGAPEGPLVFRHVEVGFCIFRRLFFIFLEILMVF